MLTSARCEVTSVSHVHNSGERKHTQLKCVCWRSPFNHTHSSSHRRDRTWWQTHIKNTSVNKLGQLNDTHKWEWHFWLNQYWRVSAVALHQSNDAITTHTVSHHNLLNVDSDKKTCKSGGSYREVLDTVWWAIWHFTPPKSFCLSHYGYQQTSFFLQPFSAGYKNTLADLLYATLYVFWRTYCEL